MTLKDAYSTRELTQLISLSIQGVLDRASRENWQSRPRVGRGGGREWLVASMPEETRAALQVAVLRAEEKALPVVVASAEVAPVSPIPADTVVPDWAWNLAKARCRIVMEWRQHAARQVGKGSSKKETTLAFVTAYNAGLLLPDAVHALVAEISLPTLYRWDAELRKHHDDMQVLADRRGAWTRGGAKGLGQIGREAESFFLAAYLGDSNITMRTAWLAACSALEVKGLPTPSYSGVRRFFERYDAAFHDVVVFAREGAKALSDTVGGYLSREDGILEVGDVLISDGHRMNFMMINPDTGKPARFTLVGWQDWASRVFVAFEIMLEENTQAIASSFHRAVVLLGKMPKSVLIDNGKAYKNQFFENEADMAEFDGLYLRLGIHAKHSAPYVARTKIIERWWGDFDRQAARAIDSYVGACIDDKPAHLMRNETWHRERQSGWVPTLEDVKRMVTDYAMWKAMQPHPTRPNTTPWEVFNAGRGPGFSEAERAELARDFMHRRMVHPRRCRFTMAGLTFESDELYGINKSLSAHYAYSDLSEVFLYDNGRLVTVARPVETVHPMAELFGTALDMQHIKQRQKEQAKLRADTRKIAGQVTTGSVELLMGLPYMQGVAERRQAVIRREPELPFRTDAALPEASATPVVTQAEATALTELVTRRKAQIVSKGYTPPPFFSSELERYDFLFNVRFVENLSLSPDDADFMARYEASEEYRTTTGRRYEQLRRTLYTHVQPLEQSA